MKKDFLAGFETLESKKLLSGDSWYLYNSQADKVWPIVSEIIQLSKPVVAVIDSGIDLNHDSLKNNIWTNNSDPVDGIDNDNSGKEIGLGNTFCFRGGY